MKTSKEGTLQSWGSPKDQHDLDVDSSLERIRQLEKHLRKLGIGNDRPTRPRKMSKSMERFNSKPPIRKRKKTDRGKSAEFVLNDPDRIRRLKMNEARSLVTGRERRRSRSTGRAYTSSLSNNNSHIRSRSRDTGSDFGSEPRSPPLPTRSNHSYTSRKSSKMLPESNRSRSRGSELRSSKLSRKAYSYRDKSRLSIGSAHSIHNRSRSMPQKDLFSIGGPRHKKRSPSPATPKSRHRSHSRTRDRDRRSRKRHTTTQRRQPGTRRRKQSDIGEVPEVNLRALRSMTKTNLITGRHRKSSFNA